MTPIYTNSSRQALQIAVEIADKIAGGSVRPEHILIGLVECDGTSAHILSSSNEKYNKFLYVSNSIIIES